MTRRDFCALLPFAGAAAPARIKAFCVDFNWRRPRHSGWHNDFARPGHWADASPAEHVAWYEALGANVIQTFCVSCNGYAWYKNGFVPQQPGLKHDFLPEMVELGHRKGMLVLGYFCAGANTKWGQDHPELSYGSPSTLHIPFTDEYLDYLCRSITDAVRRTKIDGYMLDWVWTPDDKLRETGWSDCERKLYGKLTGKRFPAGGRPGAAEKLVYERAAIERCWARVREATKKASPDCIIWLTCNNLTDSRVIDTRMLHEADWVLNEAPNPEYYARARKMVGPQARLIQCLVGWPGHDARAYLFDRSRGDNDLYGFAEPGDNSLPRPVFEYLSKPVSAFTGTDPKAANDRNIAALARFYRGLPVD